MFDIPLFLFMYYFRSLLCCCSFDCCQAPHFLLGLDNMTQLLLITILVGHDNGPHKSTIIEKNTHYGLFATFMLSSNNVKEF